MITVIASILSAASAIIVCLLNNHFQRKRDDAKHESDLARQQSDLTAHMREMISTQQDGLAEIKNDIGFINYQITELKAHVDKHNNVIERTYELEKRTDLQEEKIKVANNRIADLERINEKSGN